MTFTDLPVRVIGYPSTGYLGRGKGVLLGAYLSGREAREFGSLPPSTQVSKAVDYGAIIHPGSTVRISRAA